MDQRNKRNRERSANLLVPPQNLSILPMLQASTLDFLRQLKANNNTVWFHDNRKQYDLARQNVELLVADLIIAISKFDPAIAQVSPKSCFFRINRDIRFSKDKTPYKTNMGAYITKEGKKSVLAGYYLHIEPDNQGFLAGGMYQPMPNLLAAIRQEIDYHQEEFKQIIESPNFIHYFGTLEGAKLQTAPKGYPKDHLAIEWLKHKDFVVTHALTDQQLLADNLANYSQNVFAAMLPLNQFMNRTVIVEQ